MYICNNRVILFVSPCSLRRLRLRLFEVLLVMRLTDYVSLYVVNGWLWLVDFDPHIPVRSCSLGHHCYNILLFLCFMTGGISILLESYIKFHYLELLHLAWESAGILVFFVSLEWSLNNIAPKQTVDSIWINQHWILLFFCWYANLAKYCGTQHLN